MTECQGCGAWNERRRTLCVLCGTPLAETDEWDAAAELPPLPPLPDGGLSATMPAWLRDEHGPRPQLTASPHPQLLSRYVGEGSTEPVLGAAATANDVLETDAESPSPGARERASGETFSGFEPPLGPQADPRTFLRDDDFPRWIRELPALPPRSMRPVAAIVPPVVNPAPVAAPPADPAPPRTPLPDPMPAAQEAAQQDRYAAEEAGEPLPVPVPPPAATDADPDAMRPRREAWETPLLVVLVVGVALAVLWALLINGMIGGGL